MSTTALAKQTSQLKTLITGEAMQIQFAKLLPEHLSPERFSRVALNLLGKIPKLAECTQESFFRCLLDLSAAGLEPDNKRAYIIPYGKEATLIIGYQGLIDIVRRDPNVVDVQCFKIRANDKALWVNGKMEHSFNPLHDRGEVVATYTKLTMTNGTTSEGEPFTKADAEKAKKSSKTSANGPWKDHYEEMWRKSNIRRDAKMWPMSPEIRDHLEKDDSYGMRNVTHSASPMQAQTQVIDEKPVEEKPPAQEAQTAEEADPDFAKS